MNTFLKATCIVIYVTAVIGALGVLHAGFTSIAQQVAVIFLALHVHELLVAFRSVQRHPGTITVDAAARSGTRRRPPGTRP